MIMYSTNRITPFLIEPSVNLKILNALLTKQPEFDLLLMRVVILKMLSTLFLKKILTAKSTSRIIPQYSKKLLTSIQITPSNPAIWDAGYKYSVLLNTFYELLNSTI